MKSSRRLLSYDLIRQAALTNHATRTHNERAGVRGGRWGVGEGDVRVVGNVTVVVGNRVLDDVGDVDDDDDEERNNACCFSCVLRLHLPTGN